MPLNRLNGGLHHRTHTRKAPASLFFGARCNQPHLLFSFSRGADPSVTSCPHPPASSFLAHWLAQLRPVILTVLGMSRPPSVQQPGRSLGKTPSWGPQTPGSPAGKQGISRTPRSTGLRDTSFCTARTRQRGKPSATQSHCPGPADMEV